jgi:hypothetical protein
MDIIAEIDWGNIEMEQICLWISIIGLPLVILIAIIYWNISPGGLPPSDGSWSNKAWREYHKAKRRARKRLNKMK